MNRSQEKQTQDLRKLLEELYKLLEMYAPVWYTEELHNNLLGALKTPDKQESPASHIKQAV
jgi:hypothetical protein